MSTSQNSWKRWVFTLLYGLRGLQGTAIKTKEHYRCSNCWWVNSFLIIVSIKIEVNELIYLLIFINKYIKVFLAINKAFLDKTLWK